MQEKIFFFKDNIVKQGSFTPKMKDCRQKQNKIEKRNSMKVADMRGPPCQNLCKF